MKRSKVEIERTINDGPRRARPSFTGDYGEIGTITMHDAAFVFAALEQHGDDQVATLAVGRAGCPCGCKASGMGFIYRLTPDQARAVATQLLSVTDDVERNAATQAAAVLVKAAGK